MRLFLVFSLLLFLSIPAFGVEKQATAILLDNSKSVSASDFQKAKELIAQMRERFEGPTLLFLFGTDMRKISPEELSSVQATESYTMIYDAAYDAAKELSAIDAERRAIIIVSDGYDTKSATILEDIVQLANRENISVYGVGVANANRKVLERMARLTGGKYYALQTSGLADQMAQSVLSQEKIAKTEEKQPAVVQQQPKSRPVSSSPPAVTIPVEPKREQQGIPWKWILLLLLGAVIVGAVVLIVARSYRSDARVCPTCGLKLESYQTVCPVCSVPQVRGQPQRARVEKTVEIDLTQHPEVPAIPMELLEKKPVTEEMLSKTFVLMETPMLVVRKGKNLGQTFSLNRSFPISIGRSRVNEIRLDDTTISGQHCRIIPENGKHVLYDLNSTNGTFLNDKKVNRSILKEGDTIRIGETQFLFKVEQHRN